MHKTVALFLVLFTLSLAGFSQNYVSKKDIPYVSVNEKDPYKLDRCKLDIYYPTDKKDYPTIVWFHGGGLEGGEKGIPQELKDKGMAVVAVNYRLSPKATNPAYIEDAAESVAWVFRNIKSFGGSTGKIYVSGHSAGGYLALMVGLDRSYLNKYGINADQIKGLIPISGQTNTHYTIRKERGLPFDIPYIDQYAPLTHSRNDASPILLVTGDKNLEMTARYEENAHLYAILKALGHKDVTLYGLEGFDHGTVCAPACYLAIDWIRKHEKQ